MNQQEINEEQFKHEEWVSRQLKTFLFEQAVVFLKEKGIEESSYEPILASAFTCALGHMASKLDKSIPGSGLGVSLIETMFQQIRAYYKMYNEKEMK